MIRTIGLLCAVVSLSACSGDGRGSQYSSARAAAAAPTYSPVTQGARPVTLQERQDLVRPVSAVPAVTTGAGGGQARVVSTAALPAASATAVKFATGPIYSACLGAERREATRARCGCVQWVADRRLTDAQQRRGARYFEKQQDLQEVRQSDGRANEEFWTAWQDFGATAGTTCRST